MSFFYIKLTSHVNSPTLTLHETTGFYVLHEQVVKSSHERCMLLIIALPKPHKDDGFPSQHRNSISPPSSASEPTHLADFSSSPVSWIFSKKVSLYSTLTESSLSLRISNFLYLFKISLYVPCSWGSLSFLVHIFKNQALLEYNCGSHFWFHIIVTLPPYKKA